MRDLFGEIVVTEDDIRAWVEALAPAFTSSSRSYTLYVRGWNVIEKVKRAKTAGTFDSTIAEAHERRQRVAKRLGFRIAPARRRSS